MERQALELDLAFQRRKPPFEKAQDRPASEAHLYQDKVIEEKKNIEGDVKVSTKEYVIQAGDTLWAIAKQEYGDGKQWKRIYEFNKNVIKNPDRPRKGTKIQIPIE